MLSGFLVLFIHAVCMFISPPDILRHFLWPQTGKTVFVSVPDRLFIIPALEAQHIQNPVHPLDFRLQLSFSEFPYAGVPLHRGKQPFLVIIPQGGYGQIKHLGLKVGAEKFPFSDIYSIEILDLP